MTKRKCSSKTDYLKLSFNRDAYHIPKLPNIGFSVHSIAGVHCLMSNDPSNCWADFDQVKALVSPNVFPFDWRLREDRLFAVVDDSTLLVNMVLLFDKGVIGLNRFRNAANDLWEHQFWQQKGEAPCPLKPSGNI